MVNDRRRVRAVELRSLGLSLREIAAALGVAHDTVRRWTADVGPGPASVVVEGAGAVETGVNGVQAAPAGDLDTSEGRRARLDDLIQTWTERASTDRFAAGMVERLLRQRETLASEERDRVAPCTGHMDTSAVRALMLELETFVRLEVSINLHRFLTGSWFEVLREQEDDGLVKERLATCENRIHRLFEMAMRDDIGYPAERIEDIRRPGDSIPDRLTPTL